MSKRRKVVHVVAVHWLDAKTNIGWHDADEPVSLSSVVAVGVFHRIDKETISIAPLMSKRGSVGDPVAIPLSQVLSVSYCALKLDPRDLRRRGKYRFSKDASGEPWSVETRKERKARQKREAKGKR